MSESDETIIEIGNDGQFDIPSLPTLELPSPLSFKFVEKLKELARTKPTAAKAQTILNSIIGGAVSQKSEIKEESK